MNDDSVGRPTSRLNTSLVCVVFEISTKYSLLFTPPTYVPSHLLLCNKKRDDDHHDPHVL